ncbi:hypothetical protein AB3X91_11760 [Paraburkholderia sp. BR14263]|uniref:hypothetical protein n=1 Tax=unclassified Paraburkholderia TaxID=2615204 RepID=UPI0034CEF602
MKLIQPQPMCGRRQLRLAAIGALQKASLQVSGTAVEIVSPGDWDASPEDLPAIFVRTGHETKAAILRGPSEDTTTCNLEVKVILEAGTAEAAQDAIEALWYDVENALLTNYSLLGMLQQISGIESALQISAEGARHLAGLAAVLRCEFFESFDPQGTSGPKDLYDPASGAAVWPNDAAAPVPLTGGGITVDPTNVADPSGTYPDAPFPQAVTPAPRTQGPDGRSEGVLDIPLQGA